MLVMAAFETLVLGIPMVFFSNNSEDFENTDLVTMDIETRDSLPISQKPYNLSSKHIMWVQKGIRDTVKGKNYCPKCFSLGQSHCGCPKTNSTWKPPTEKVVHRLSIIKNLLPLITKAHSKDKRSFKPWYPCPKLMKCMPNLPAQAFTLA